MVDGKKGFIRTVLPLVLAAAVATGATWKLDDMKWRSEVVRRGYAHWVVTDDHGGTKFEWVERK